MHSYLELALVSKLEITPPFVSGCHRLFIRHLLTILDCGLTALVIRFATKLPRKMCEHCQFRWKRPTVYILFCGMTLLAVIFGILDENSLC